MGLTDTLIAIQVTDPSADDPFPGASYDRRNMLVYRALAQALELGYLAGIRVDELDTDWPIAFIDLPTGQVSWHMPAYPARWDGHSTKEKYLRCRTYAKLSSLKQLPTR